MAAQLTPENSTPGTSPQASTSTAPPVSSSPFSFSGTSNPPRRVLACVLCQQRKIKCERKFPCSNCLRSNARCVPATAVGPRQRKPRFPERALLERLRKYENLLRSNSIDFEPMHKGSAAAGEGESPELKEGNAESDDDLGDVESVHEAKDFWDVMTKGFRGLATQGCSSSDMPHEAAPRQPWDGIFENDDQLLFGLRRAAISLPSLQPEPVQAFRLWQVYLDNVNPLLKVTHTPSLQPRIIEAIGDVTKLSPAMEALMFSIYCMALHSLSEDECESMFGSSKGDLSHRYGLGCQQALVNCQYLRTNDRDCLTALYLFLHSIGSNTDPRSLSAMLGVAMRIAQRMGLHSEAASARHPPFEVEMRRRLWWALAIYDSRIGELADYKSTGLTPTWDCKTPLSVNDSELWPDMKELPAMGIAEQSKASEAVFAVVRAELANFIRHTVSYLAFSGPALKPISKKLELPALEKMIQDKFLKSCDPENPLHLMAMCTARSFLARARLMDYYSKQGAASLHPTEAQRDASVEHALSYLESDTKMAGAPRLRGYYWLFQMYFPLPAYIHMFYDLRTRPLGTHADRAWEVMSQNYDARIVFLDNVYNPRLKALIRLILMAWEARGEAVRESGGGGGGEAVTPPRIVSNVKAIFSAQGASAGSDVGIDTAQTAAAGGGGGGSDMASGMNEMWMSMPMGFVDGQNFTPYGMDWQSDAFSSRGVDAMMPGPAGFDANINQLNWATMGWDLGER